MVQIPKYPDGYIEKIMNNCAELSGLKPEEVEKLMDTAHNIAHFFAERNELKSAGEDLRKPEYVKALDDMWVRELGALIRFGKR